MAEQATLTQPKTWEEAVEAGKIGLPQLDGYTLDVEEASFGDGEYGIYAELTGQIASGPHAGFKFGVPGQPRCFIGKEYIVHKLQQRLVTVPFRVQFKLGQHPEDATKQMWRIALLTFPKS